MFKIRLSKRDAEGLRRMLVGLTIDITIVLFIPILINVSGCSWLGCIPLTVISSILYFAGAMYALSGILMLQ
jgi:hypothetical protein